MRVAIYVIVLFCAYIIEELGAMSNFSCRLLASIAGASLFWDYWESRTRQKK